MRKRVYKKTILYGRELTHTELETARLILLGKNRSEVAALLNLPYATVLGRLNRTYEKLGVHSRAGLRQALLDGKIAMAPDKSLRGKPLTQSEFNVAYLIAQGKTQSEAAQMNHITINAVKGRMKFVYEKLGVSTNIELRRSFEQGSLKTS